MGDDKEDIKWEKGVQLGPVDSLKPIFESLIMILEMEKKRTLEQLEQLKKLLKVKK